MATEKLEAVLDLKVAGADAFATASNNAISRLTAMETASVSMASASAKTTTAVRATSLQFEKFGSTLGLAAQGIGRFSPTLGAMTQQIGAATGSATAMAGALGPMGALFGGAATGATLMITAMTGLNKAFKDAKNSGRSFLDEISAGFEAGSKANRAIVQFDEVVTKALGVDGFQGLLESAAKGARYWGGVISQVFADAMTGAKAMLDAAAMAQEAIANGEFDQAAMAFSAGVSAVGSIGQGFGDRANRAGLVGAFGGIAAGGGAEPGARPTRSRGGGGGGGPSAGEQFADWARSERNPRFQGMQSSEYAGDVDAAQIARDEAALAAERERIALVEQAIGLNEKQADQDERAVAAIEAKIEKTATLAGIIGGDFVKAIDTAINSERSLGAVMKQIAGERLRALAIEESIMAIVETAKGIAALILAPKLAATHFAAAAKHGVAAAAAGGGAAILGATGGGGGGGGGSSESTSASPTRDTSQSASGGGDQNITIYFGSPVVTATTVAELGREIKSAILVADARYGV